MSPRRCVVTDTSRPTYGRVYHALFDPPLAEARRVVVDLVPPGATVVDIACGTGELCFALAAEKGCRVVGVDLSRRMIDFARKRNRHDTVRLYHCDAANLTGLEPSVFDYATILFLLHEVPREKQIAVLKEALRVARLVVAVDSLVPLPRNLHGIALRVVEASGGREHYRPFADYLAAGGISGILTDPRLGAAVVRQSVFWHGCREMVILAGQTDAAP